MKNITGILVLFAVFLSLEGFAQQEPIYGQYLFNKSVINPAQAGAENLNQWGMLARYQWVGIVGAPRTMTAYANFRLPHQLGVSAGLYVDQLGPEEKLQFQTDMAYHSRLSDNWYLAAGIRLVASHITLNLRDLPGIEPNDPNFQEKLSSGLMFNGGAGLLAYSNRSFFGVSLPKAVRNEYGNKNIVNSVISRHLFAYAGTNIELSNELTMIPSVLFKYSDDAPIQFDLNAMFGLREVLDFGPMIRSNTIESWLDAVGFLVGLHFSEHWYFGYAYEYPMNDLSLATIQTHEISLRYMWGAKYIRRIRSPRYFL